MKKTALFALIGVFLLLVAAGIWLARNTPPEITMPEPNGYVTISKAARDLKGGDALANHQKLNLSSLALLVQTNAPVLQEVRRGLAQEFRVPTSQAPKNAAAAMSQHVQETARFRQLALAFAAESDLARRENRLEASLRADLDILKLSRATGHGGLIVDAMVGQAIEATALSALESWITSLQAADLKIVLHTLQEHAAGRDSVEEIIRAEEQWAKAVFGFKGTLMRLATRGSLKRAENKLAQVHLSNDYRTRLLMARTAARLYEIEHGHPAEKLSDLVPTYLKEVPTDPQSGKEIQNWK